MVWPRCTVTRQAFHISSEFTVLTLYRTIVVAGIAVCVDAKSITVGAGSGDEDCPVQTYSNNVRVLMDSWRYQSLLSNTNDGVWTTYNSGDSQSNSVVSHLQTSCLRVLNH